MSFVLREYQHEIERDTREAYKQGFRAPLIQCPTGGGKCLGRGTPVMLYDGRVVPVEEIVVGDLLMGPDSRPRRVLSTTSGRERLYRVMPKKGDPYVVNESHILSTKRTKTGARFAFERATPIVNIGVLEWLAASATFKHTHKGWRAPVEFDGRLPLHPALPPYMLGLWLGDGTSRTTSITVGAQDPEIANYIITYAASRGMTVRVDGPGHDRCPTYHVTGGGSLNVMRSAMSGYRLFLNKHVPLAYKTASREDRLDLLAGLMDSDGSYTGKGFDFISKNERVADDVCFVARSLGLAAYKRETSKTCGNNGVTGRYFRVSISGDVDMIPCRVSRKKAKPRTQKKSVLVTGIKVEPTGFGDYFGFEIDGDRLFLLGDFTVTHNTVTASKILHGAEAKGNRGLFLLPRRELVYQSAQKLQRYGVCPGIIMAGEPMHFERKIQLASFDTLHARAIKTQKIELPEAKIVGVDECFVAGTMVDGTPIESISVGARLLTGEVTAVSSRPCSIIVEVIVNDGRAIACTPNHPMMTTRGWVDAGDLREYDELVSICELQINDEEISRKDGRMCELRKIFHASEIEASSDVLSRVLSGLAFQERASGLNKVCSRGEVANNARQQSDAIEESSPESLGETARDELAAKNSWWERTRANCSRAIDRVRSWMGHVSCRGDESRASRQKVSELLQNRRREQRLEDWDRGQWKQSLGVFSSSSGSKETKFLAIARVAHVRIHKQGSGDGFGRLCPQGVVYNLEVDSSHMYFANGLLAHNCHLSVAPTRKKIIANYEKSIVFGLTATPARSDGKALGDIYDVLIKSWSVRRMMDEGYLVEAQYACPTAPDLAKIRVRGGDYVESDLDEAMDNPKLVGDIVDNWCRLASTRRTVVFCVTRKHARHVTEAFKKIGVRAEYVDGETPLEERKQIFRNVETGATQVLVNVLVATFGLDIPPLDCIIIARPTKSLVLYLQMVGRVLRPVFMDGEPDGKEMRLAAIAASIKKDALVLDHSGAVHEHGFVDDEIPWALKFDGTISQRKEAQQKEKNEPKEIVCEMCKTAFKGSRYCPKCGHAMVPAGEAVPTHKADLQKVERDGNKANKKDSWDEKKEFYAQALGYAIEKRYKTSFADSKYKEKYGVWPNDPRVRNALPSGERQLIHGWIAHMAMRRKFAS